MQLRAVLTIDSYPQNVKESSATIHFEIGDDFEELYTWPCKCMEQMEYNLYITFHLKNLFLPGARPLPHSVYRMYVVSAKTWLCLILQLLLMSQLCCNSLIRTSTMAENRVPSAAATVLDARVCIPCFLGVLLLL